MKTSLALALAAALAPFAAAQTAPDAVLLRHPDVSRDHVVFRFANDLWVVDKRGGEARPLSSPEGAESLPKFSPDGNRIAFIGGYDGGSDLYVLDLDGGVPRRVTHHPGREILCDWTPDGEGLLFFSSAVSGQQRAPKMFRVPAAGGQPVALAIPYGTFGALDAGGDWLAYTPVTQSEFRTWKRYQGGFAQDVWLFNLKSFESRRVTDFPGTDALPMWHGGELVILSDRDEHARLNLWSYDVEQRTFAPLTSFSDDDVRFPSIGPDDVVFEHAGKIQRFEFATRTVVPVEISIPGDRPKLRPRTISVERDVAGVSIGPNARRAVVEARGDLYSVPVEEGVALDLTASDGVAERYPSWSPDGQWIAYFTDASGEYELAVRRADGRAFRWTEFGDEVSEKRLTEIGPGWKYAPRWAPDSKSLVFATSAGELRHLVLDTGKLATLATNPAGEPVEVAWSGDSRWLAWSQRSSAARQSAIFLYDLQSNALHEVTSGRFEDREPCFDASGDWLFFLSSRHFEAIYSDFDDTWVYANSTVLLAVPLRPDVENPFLVADPSEAGDAKGEKETEKKDADETAEEAPKPVAIDLAGFESRALQLPVDAGNLRNLRAGKATAFYVRAPRKGSAGEKAKLVQFDLAAEKDERKEKVVLEGVAGFERAAKAEKLFVALDGGGGDGGYCVVDAKPEQKAERKLDLSALEATVDPRREWAQILADAHRILRDFFYEPTMHGTDWRGIYERYARVLSDATSRDDLHFVLGEMIAELNVGHAYNPGGPGVPEDSAPGRAAGLIGCDFELQQGAYRIVRILGLGAADADARGPLAQPGIDAREGDWLLAVNGESIDARRDVYAAFLGLAGRPVALTLSPSARRDGAERAVIVTPIESEGELRYRDWVERNRKLVDELSAGRIGYVHVPDTGVHGQTELVRQLASQYHKDALLVDERWNSGGQVPTRFIELLDRPLTNFWAIRNGEDWQWPPLAQQGPKAMLINGSSGSGGDAFPYYFRQAGLGALIGMRTWGGLVGLTGNPGFVDGTSITVPRFAFYEKDGTWGVEGYGVAPDIEVIDDPALMVHGEDPQLAAGVAHLLKELEAWTFERPARPAPPNRSGAGIAPQDR